MVRTVASGFSNGQQVSQFLLDQVADHPFGLGTQDVERIRRDLVVRGRLQREQPDLRPVAVRDDQLVLLRHGGERLAGRRHVGTLPLHGHRLAPALQRVAPQRDDDPHRPSSESSVG